jgi:hypothetical protein
MRRILSAVTLVLLAACSDATGSAPTTDVRVETEKPSYGIIGNQAVPVTFTITNTTAAAVQLTGCGGEPGIAMERREAGRWINFTASICPANVVMTPVTLAPGATVSSQVILENAVGTFRITLPNPNVGVREPLAISPTFDVHVMLD